MASPTTCPSCGAEVSLNARGCRECGMMKEDGRWLESEIYDGLDLPDDDFDYDEFVAREFGGEKAKLNSKQAFWWLVALLTLIAFAWLAFKGW